MFTDFGYVLGEEFSKVNCNKVTPDLVRKYAPKILGIHQSESDDPIDDSINVVISFDAVMSRYELRAVLATTLSVLKHTNDEAAELRKIGGSVEDAIKERENAAAKYRINIRSIQLACSILEFGENDDEYI